MADYKIRHYMPQFPEITLPMTDAKYRPSMLLGEAEISNIDFTLSLDSIPTLTYDLSFDNDIHAASEPCIPYVTDFELVRNNVVILAGMHTGVKYRISDRFLTAAGAHWKHWFERSIWPYETPDVAVDSDPTFVREETDTIQIAYDLLRETSLGAVVTDYNLKKLYAGVLITLSSQSDPASGLDIDYFIEYADDEKVLDKVDELSRRHPGFDWDITPDRQFIAYAPYRFRNQTIILEEGTNITDTDFDDNGPIATRLYGRGSNSEGQTNIRKHELWADESFEVYSGSVRHFKYRLMSDSVDYGSVEDDGLDRLTKGDLRRSVRQTEVITTKAVQEKLDLSDIEVGDIFPVIAPNEHKPIDGSTWRLTNIHVVVDNEGNEDITLTLDNSHLAYVE